MLRADNVFRFDGLSFAAAAVATDAVATPWRALRVRRALRSGERVLIAGAGGLGLNAVQVALNAGAAVAAVDPDGTHGRRRGRSARRSPWRRTRWRRSSRGATAAPTSGSRRPAVPADSIPSPRPVRSGGRIVCCGCAPGSSWPLDSMRLVLSELAVIGSRASSREDARAAVEAGEIVPAIASTMQLEDVKDALVRLRGGGLAGRLVIEIP